MTASTTNPLSLRRVLKTWWPLAASWLLMGTELPALSIVIARLANPEINLAAYGGVVFPLALIIESPVIMLLAASTALSKDWASYRKIRRFMLVIGGSLSVLHALVAFTPLYYVVVGRIIGAPQEIIEPARVGLMILTPWTGSIAYRRFNQGVLIRFNHSLAVGLGTIVRLLADSIVLAIGFFAGTIPGVIVGASAVTAGVISEAVFAGLIVRPVIRNELKPAPPVQDSLTLRGFLDFYIPLAMTSLLFLIVQPIGSAAISRMPDALISLAVWPVVNGLLFMVRSLGVAYNEVVVALLDEPQSSRTLKQFNYLLAISSTALLFLLAGTSLSEVWFGVISGLQPPLVKLAETGLWIGLIVPALNVFQSWFQGAILHGKRTRGITEAVVVYLVSSAAVLTFGVLWGKTTGLYVGLGAFVVSMLTQTAWLWYRSRPVIEKVAARDESQGRLSSAEALAD